MYNKRGSHFFFTYGLYSKQYNSTIEEFKYIYLICQNIYIIFLFLLLLLLLHKIMRN